jgi:uroporphyrinogen-III synthase
MSNDKHRILCTRPLTDSLIAVAGKSGIGIDVQEFIQIKPVANPALWGRENMGKVFHQDAVHVFTSAKAVTMLAKYYIRQGADCYLIRKPNICCISGNTKKLALEKFPYCNILAEASYGLDLANAIIQLGSIHEVNFFCGNQRRNELPDTLKNAGITVNEYVVYENIPTPIVTADDYDGIMFFSPSAVKSYFSANRIHQKTICFAIGRTTATSLREHTDNKIIMSAGTNEDYMVQTAIFYFNNINCYE